VEAATKEPAAREDAVARLRAENEPGVVMVVLAQVRG
jgi:hypothetical protein